MDMLSKEQKMGGRLRMLTQDKFESIVKTLLGKVERTLIDKGHDYTNKDPIENFKLLNTFNIDSTETALVLINIKLNRLNNLLLNNKTPKYESVDDTILDSIAYQVLLYVALEEKRLNMEK